jgi:hypothetical protein
MTGKVGTSGPMRIDRTIKHVTAGLLLLAAVALGGCSTSIADLPGFGTPADAPARPKEAGGYLPVHDLPPDREEAAMKPAEQAKIEAELIAARDRQASSAAAPKPAAK